jgi:hypothetical protein
MNFVDSSHHRKVRTRLGGDLRLETWKKDKKDKISGQHLPEESGNLCPFIKHIRQKFNKLPTIQMIFWQCLFATYEVNLAVS